MKILLIFIVVSAINVLFSTTRSLITVNGGKWAAALACAIYNAFNNIMVIYTVADFPIWEKCLITFICNLTCVAIVKGIEERHKPTLMWKIELAIPRLYYVDNNKLFKENFRKQNIACHFEEVGKYVIFNCYCDTKEQVKYLKKVCKRYDGRMSAYESAPLF